MRCAVAVVFLFVASCGGRTQLYERVGTDAGVHPVDAGKDSGPIGVDAAPPDAGPPDAGDCGFDQDPSPQATSGYGACGEAINITSPPTDNVSGAGAAFEYVPETDVVVGRIELHTTGGSVGLLDSDCDLPAKVLFYGPLPTSPTPAWLGADVFPPVTVKAGHRYFVYESTAGGSGEDSAATSGVEVREYTTPNGVNGPWGGPFGGIAWSAHLIGVCP
jgi:hypothetical protein